MCTVCIHTDTGTQQKHQHIHEEGEMAPGALSAGSPGRVAACPPESAARASVVAAQESCGWRPCDDP